MADSEKTQNVPVRASTLHLVRKESKRLKQTQTRYVDAAVRYFAERGLDPEETQAREGQLIMNQVKRLGDRVFSYLVEQEKTIHVVVLEELIRGRVVQEKLLRQEQVIEALLRNKADDYLAQIRGQDHYEIETAVAEAMKMLKMPGKSTPEITK